MKQIPLNPKIIEKIKAVAGPDVSTDGLAVFEAIALNTLPIVGKNGSIFEKAVVTPLTLRQMAEHINAKGLPLAEDHIKDGPPLGRVFDAEFMMNTDGPSVVGELRTLFYMDPTETDRITKLNAGVIDEVSVSFGSTAMLCSECGWDYLGEDATFSNFVDRTCKNGHAIGTDGVHVNMTGLSSFTELSLVQLGAANNAKIVGKSNAKLPAASYGRLAARGFEVEQLCLTTTKGEYTVDFDKILAQLTAATTLTGTLQAEATVREAALTAANAQIADLKTANEKLTADLAAAAEAAKAADELTAARDALTAQLSALYTASGETPPESLPTSIADLKAGIDALTGKLTALIPTGGVSDPAGKPASETKTKSTAGFKLAK